MSVQIEKEKCISCGACVVICKFKSLKLVNGKAVVDPSLCTDCGDCIYKCYTRAIHQQNIKSI